MSIREIKTDKFESHDEEAEHRKNEAARRSFSANFEEKHQPVVPFELSNQRSLSLEVNLEEALQHQLANRLLAPVDEDKKKRKEYETCKCCGNIIHNDEIRILGGISEFFHLGPAIPLYLEFLSNLLLMVLIQMFVVDIYSFWAFS